MNSASGLLAALRKNWYWVVLIVALAVFVMMFASD